MSTKSTKEELAIESRIANLRQQLKRQEEMLTAAKMKRADVQIGEIVIFKGEKHRVCEVKPGGYGKDWAKGNPVKKDGTFGTAMRNLYGEWTKPV